MGASSASQVEKLSPQLVQNCPWSQGGARQGSWVSREIGSSIAGNSGFQLAAHSGGKNSLGNGGKSRPVAVQDTMVGPILNAMLKDLCTPQGQGQAGSHS